MRKLKLESEICKEIHCLLIGLLTTNKAIGEIFSGNGSTGWNWYLPAEDTYSMCSPWAAYFVLL